MRSVRLLEGSFQLKFLIKFCLLTAAGFSALTIGLYLVTGRDLGHSYGEAMYAIYSLRINIFSLVLASVYSIATMVVTVVFIALTSIFFSHKMAGPIFRLTRDLELLASGDLTVETSFRESDQLALLAREKNKMTERLTGLVVESRESLMAVKKQSGSLCALLREAEELEGSGECLEGEAAEGIRELEGLVKELSSRISAIKTAQ